MAEEIAVTTPEPPEDFRAFKAFMEPGEKPAVAAEPAPAVQDPSAEPEAKAPATENAEEEDASKQEQAQERDEHGKFKPKEPTLAPDVQAAVDKRINKAVAAQREAERRADEADRKLAERQAPEPDKTPKPATDDRPKLEDFDSIPAWKDADDDWKEAKRTAQTAAREQQTKIGSFMEAGAKLAEDFRAQAKAVGAKVSPAVADAIVESGEPKLVTYLHEHPEELTRLQALSPTSAVREIGKLEAKLVAPPVPETKTPAVSKAPKPPTPVGAAAAPTKPNIYDENIDFRAFKAAREAELSRR